jgi:ATP-dependent helicase IRC3
MMNVMATGTGKTVVFAKLFEKMKSRLPGQMMVLAHTEELVEQNRKKLQNVNPTLKVGKEMARQYADSQDDIISASVATVGRMGSKRLSAFPNIDKLVVDEAHHSTAEAYGRVFEATGVLGPQSPKLLLGVTATPQRPDGKALSDIYEKVAFVYGMRQAISDKFLVPVRGFRVTTDTSLSDISKSDGDFVKSELGNAVNNESRNKRIVDAWKKVGENRKTLVFTVDIEHAKKQAEEFQKAGVDAEAVWGDDPLRADKLEKFRNGEFKVLCNCSVLVEGYDDPSIACVILARPTASGVLFTQMVGRGTRLFPGKEDLIAIDIVDTSISHSLVTLPTLMGMSNVLDIKGKDLLWAVETIEAAQAANPSIDFTKLKDIDELPTLIQSVNMFEVRFPKEVEQNSELTWFRAIDGGYKMLIPKESEERAGFMKIYENPLGQWDIVGRIKDVQLKASRPSMEEAFKASDEQIRKRIGKVTLSYLLREATWHNKPVSSGQKKMLERLFPYKKFDYEQMTSGQASRVIGERLAKKATK